MASPVIQFKRGALANLPGLRAGEPGWTTDAFDLYVGIDSTTSGNKIVGSHRFWTNNTTTTGSGVNLVEGTSNGTSFITLKAPDSLAGIVTYTMPGTDGSTNQVLATNGSGTLSFIDAVATLSIADDGANTDVVNLLTDTLTFSEGEGINAVVTDNTVTISGEDASDTNKGIASFVAADFDVASGAVSLEDTVVKTVTTDSGALTPSSHGFSVLGGEGLDVTHTGTTITVAGEDASDTNKGIASFLAADFDVASGAVSLEDTVVKAVTTDSGALTPSSHGFSILGGEGLDVTHTGTTITVAGEDASTTNKGIAQFNSSDFEVSSGVVGISTLFISTISVTGGGGEISGSGHSINFAAGEGVNIGAAGSTITISGEDASDTNKGIASFDLTDFTVTSGDVTINAERIQDIAGAMVTGNTETLITVTYQDADGTIDFEVDNDLANYSNATSAFITASSTDTLTNKTFDANGTGNSLSNVEVADFAGSAIVTEAEGLNSSDNDTSLPTTAAVKDYVDSQVTAQDLDFSGDSGTSSVDLDSQTLTIAGTANEIETSASGQTLTVGLPNAVTVTTSLTTPTVKATNLQANDGTTSITITDSTGAVECAQNLTVQGNLIVNGSTTQVNTTQTTIEDQLLELGIVDGSAPSSDLNKDLGVLFNYYTSSAKKAAIYWDDSTSRIVVADDVSESSGVLTAATYAAFEIGSLYVNDCAGASQVISCSGSTRSLENISIDGGSF